MPEKIDFASLMADLTTLQREIGKTHEGLTNSRQKEVLGEALKKVAEARADVEVKYSQAIQAIKSSVAETQAKAKAGLERVSELEEKFAAMSARPPSKPPEKPTPKLDGQLGCKLSAELLATFADRPPLASQLDQEDREIWEDWNWSQA